MMRLNGALAEMAGGNLDVVIPGAGRGDEIGDWPRPSPSSGKMPSKKRATKPKPIAAGSDRRPAAQGRHDQARRRVRAAVGEIVETVSSASTELEASATTLTATAERSQELTTMVAAASEEASTNVQSVASATEELSSSVNEISRQVQESARMATRPSTRRARPTTASANCRRRPPASATSSN